MIMFSVLFVIMFIFVIGMFVFVIGKSIAEWNNNNHSPRLTVDAKVVTRRTRTEHSGSDMTGATMTRYYVTFQVESGDRIEFLVSGREYAMMVEGDYGKLFFQGTRFLGFERKIDVA